MDWLNISSVEQLKKYGKMKQVMQMIKKDIEKLYYNKKNIDKNVVAMITIKSNSWVGLYQKIVTFRELVTYLNDKVIEKGNENKEAKQSNYESVYFTSKEAEYIFYLLELDGKNRAEKLNISMKCYSNKSEAKRWRDSIAKVIHPDICKNPRAKEAVLKLNQLYEDMIRFG